MSEFSLKEGTRVRTRLYKLFEDELTSEGLSEHGVETRIDALTLSIYKLCDTTLRNYRRVKLINSIDRITLPDLKIYHRIHVDTDLYNAMCSEIIGVIDKYKTLREKNKDSNGTDKVTKTL